MSAITGSIPEKTWFIRQETVLPKNFLTTFQSFISFLPSNASTLIAEYFVSWQNAYYVTEDEVNDKTKFEQAIQKISGVTLATIEDRARPSAKCWFYGSQFGFLGATESMHAVVQKDWAETARLKTTPLELGSHAINLYEQIFAAKAGCHTTFLFRYDPKTLPMNTISHAPQTLEIFGHGGGKNDQADLFERAGHYCYSPSYEVRNTSNDALIVLTYHTMTYIVDLGFFQGGEEGVVTDTTNFVTKEIKPRFKVRDNWYQNPYRISPLNLFALLTGKPLSALTPPK